MVVSPFCILKTASLKQFGPAFTAELHAGGVFLAAVGAEIPLGLSLYFGNSRAAGGAELNAIGEFLTAAFADRLFSRPQFGQFCAASGTEFGAHVVLMPTGGANGAFGGGLFRQLCAAGGTEGLIGCGGLTAGGTDLCAFLQLGLTVFTFHKSLFLPKMGA